MLTSLVENFPGFRAGIQGPELMEEMRQQAAHFGTEIVQGDVSRADLSNASVRGRPCRRSHRHHRRR